MFTKHLAAITFFAAVSATVLLAMISVPAEAAPVLGSLLPR